MVERAELVLQAFEVCYDLDVAFARAGATDDERVAIEADALFHRRVKLAEYAIREWIIKGVKDVAEGAENDGVRLSALTKLGELLYAEKFRPQSVQAPTMAPNVTIELVGRGPGAGDG